jgi:hypothetical protein
MLMVVLGIFVSYNLFAQPNGYVQHDEVGGEIDSVTVGSVIEYYVAPDATVNTSYTPPSVGNGYVPAGFLSSDFTWTVPAGIGTINTGVTDADSNIVQINIAGTNSGGDLLVTVLETSGPGCAAPSTTDMSVEVIEAPTADIGNGTYDSDTAICTATPATVSIDVPVTLSTDVLDGDVQFSVVVEDAVSTVLWNNGGSPLTMDESQTSFNVPAGTFAAVGNFTVTISAVTDRISRKPATDVTGTITTSVFNITLNTVPTTGEIYRLPN